MNFFQTGYKGRNDWWMYIITFFLVFIGTQVGSIPLAVAAFNQVDGDMQRFSETANDAWLNIGMDSNLYLFLMILSFVAGLLMLYLAVRAIHKKKWKWIVTSRENIDWKRVFFGVTVWGAISVIFIGLDIFLSPESYEWNFKPIPFFTLVLVSILFIPLQTSLEEHLFRGYYMQAIGMWVKNRWFPLIVTSVIFGLLHGANPEIDKIGYIAFVFYIGTGFFFGIVTLLDEGTELAIGMHAINNIIAALFVTTDWTVFRTDALYVDTSDPSVGWEMFLPVFILYPLTIVIFSKKYGWKNWQEKLFGRVEKPIDQNVIEELGS